MPWIKERKPSPKLPMRQGGAKSPPIDWHEYLEVATLIARRVRDIAVGCEDDGAAACQGYTPSATRGG